MATVHDSVHGAQSTKHQPKSKRYYFDVGIGSVCLSGADTGGAYCRMKASVAPGMGELEVIAGDQTFVLNAGDTLIAPRGVPAPHNATAPTKPSPNRRSHRP